ncbi:MULTISPECIES: DEAD/DEAH box helicase [Clostridium]|uniref:DEAD/DEAH box helicase n=1 Tax=Clostridium TaxID=1485 RepID=UPI000826D101|nr:MULTISPECIES: DEAD/DEAH box helicase [Clostridium]PJI10369.1 DEAD/DEAH box helicase [Clostridium sp. CT7]
MENKKFSDLKLNSSVLKAIDDMGFEEPSKIQAEAIPVVIDGYDMIGQAQTGTGKTVAFGAPIISKIKDMENKEGIQSIILTPTRELAIQITDELTRLSKYARVKVLPVYGGQSIERQVRAIKRGVDIIVATPGRIMDHIKRRTVKLDKVKFLVLDEADEMLDMGFIDDIEGIIKNINSDRQTMLFSATMPQPIKRLASHYMKKEVKHIAIMKNSLTVEKIKQFYFEVKNKDKFEALCRIIDVEEPEITIIFCRTKRGVDELVESMQFRGYNVEGMHGDMSQNQRISTLKKFKENNIDFLVATDVAARGIDVHNVSHVINYDIPQDMESYVHRIGRTGRANAEGTAYSLVTPKEYIMIKQIEKFTKSKIRRKEIPTVDDIFETKYNNLIDKIRKNIEKDDFKKYVPFVEKLDDEFNIVDVSAALVKMIFDKEMNFDYKENELNTTDENVRLFFSVGRKDKLSVKKLLEFIDDTAGVSGNEVGDIDILDKFTFVDVPEKLKDVIIKSSNGKKINGRRVNIEVAKSRKKHNK